MSKTRTGRKGRIRLALAQALQDVEAGDAGNIDVVDANNRLGADSGFASSDTDKSNAVILAYVQGQLHKPGTANALFQQGEVRGPLLNAVDTQHSASGAITQITGGNLGSATGEQDLAAIAPLSTGDGTFAHYVLPDADVHANIAAAITDSTAPVSSTDLRGICYHNGGPGSDFVPLQHLGAGVGSPVAATGIIINPSTDTLWGDSGVATPTSLRIEIGGNLVDGTTGGNATEGGDEIRILSTANTAAHAGISFLVSGQGDTANGFGIGHEIVIRDENGTAICTIIGGTNGTGTLTAATGTDSGASTAGNFDATSLASQNKAYVIAFSGTSGPAATAYNRGVGTARDKGAGQFMATVRDAINALSTSQNLGLFAKLESETSTATYPTSANANDANKLTVFYNKPRGALGNKANAANSGPGASGANTVAGSLLTITGYSSEGQVLVPALTAHAYLGDLNATNGGSANDPTAAVDFQGGVTGTSYGNAVGTYGDSAAAMNSVANIPVQDLPVKVMYFNDDAARQGLSSGIPADSSAGFVIVWGPV